MKKVSCLLIYITIFAFSFSSISCSKDDDKEEPTATVKIDGKEHKVLEAGYIIPEEYDVMWVQFIIEDFASNGNESHIEIQIPKTLANDWFALTPENPNWLVRLRSSQI